MSHIDLDNTYNQCIAECEKAIDAIHNDLDEIDSIGMTEGLRKNLYNHQMDLSAWLAEARLCYDTIMGPRHDRLYHNTRRYINYQKRIRALNSYLKDAAQKIRVLRETNEVERQYWMSRQIKAEHMVNRLQSEVIEIENVGEIQQVGDSRYQNMLSVIEIQTRNALNRIYRQDYTLAA